jgi:NTP pyrophosphatase (non-canonical NTP hydrolase)
MADSEFLDRYQDRAAGTDRTAIGGGFHLAALGLFGETGSLLSELKKKRRDSLASSGFAEAVTEEMGDVLWYLATVARQNNFQLSSLAADAFGSPSDLTRGRWPPIGAVSGEPPTPGFERTLLELASSVGIVAGLFAGQATAVESTVLHRNLSSVFALLARAAHQAGISLETAAVRNLDKIADRWPVERTPPATFDSEFPEDEQLPRSLTIEIYERTVGDGKVCVVQRCNGVFIGDRLTDNIVTPDDYRFHDAFHYAYAAVLGWSPVTRALFHLKRKSEPRVDEGQDGSRAILIEEGVATFVFAEAKRLKLFAGLRFGATSDSHSSRRSVTSSADTSRKLVPFGSGRRLF